MLPYKVFLDRHDIHEDAEGASVCKASFAAYHDAEKYAKELFAAWFDETPPVVIRITGPRGNLRLLPLRTTTDNY
jgi:hypothetical protein